MKFSTHLILSEISICYYSALCKYMSYQCFDSFSWKNHSTVWNIRALDSNFLAAFKLCNLPPSFVKRAFADKREGKVNCAWFQTLLWFDKWFHGFLFCCENPLCFPILYFAYGPFKKGWKSIHMPCPAWSFLISYLFPAHYHYRCSFVLHPAQAQYVYILYVYKNSKLLASLM